MKCQLNGGLPQAELGLSCWPMHAVNDDDLMCSKWTGDPLLGDLDDLLPITDSSVPVVPANLPVAVLEHLLSTVCITYMMTM